MFLTVNCPVILTSLVGSSRMIRAGAAHRDKADSSEGMQTERARTGRNAQSTSHGAFAGDIGSLIAQASRMKRDSCRHLRKEWDTAPEFAKMSLAYDSNGDVARARELSPRSRIDAATSWKNEGNAHFVAGSMEDALEFYAKAWGTFRWFVRGSSAASEEIMLVKGDEKDSVLLAYREDVQKLLMVVAQNCAQCHINLGQHTEAIIACREALALDASNVKTLFRLAVAHRALDSSADLERAVHYLKRAQEMDPVNVDVQRLLSSIRNEIKTQDKIDRSIYGGLFERGSIEVEGAGNPSDVPPAKVSEESLQNLRRRIPHAHLREFDACVESAKQKQLDSERVKLANELGIDLGDPRVLRELERLENEHVEGATACHGDMRTLWSILWERRYLNMPNALLVIMGVHLLIRGWLIWST